ncbi:GNAT family N-acetyltransferase [Kribbella speibonae]|uniref:GNAT family N-acetyltransferase n=1 Tax=Kribbella speibonae TaxID=1572660 RepID=A0A4R0IQL7_9ACTN|nr:GNAT family N-acetyltransferase [Kribbella speibonae]TCC24641.1 GNAT family N-acetyltransferase [Kribbella speibonae]TCC30945.1 GNAT family N-acetyltransferase [Kribbella speibonae]
MENVDLRPAAADDDEFLYDLHRRALGEVIEATWGPWDDDVQREFHRNWFVPEAVEIVLVGGRRAGMVQAAMTDAATFYVSRIEIAPEMQGSGVGTAVLRGLLDRARASGAHVVELHVLQRNRARDLYERLGFQVVGVEPPKLRMRLVL